MNRKINIQYIIIIIILLSLELLPLSSLTMYQNDYTFIIIYMKYIL